MTEALVIGIGNDLRGDDAIGHLVAEAVKSASPKNATIVKKTGSGLDLLETWKGTDFVILVDAIRSGTKPGTFHFVDLKEGGPTWDLFGYSTHSVSVGEAIELGKALGNLPKQLFICAIEGQSFEFGEKVSKEVKAAVPIAVKTILETLERREYARSIVDEEFNGTD